MTVFVNNDRQSFPNVPVETDHEYMKGYTTVTNINTTARKNLQWLSSGVFFQSKMSSTDKFYSGHSECKKGRLNPETMDNPDSYQRTSDLRDDDHAQLLDEFAPTFNWRSDGKDSVMDIGCAGGNVTCDIILPKLPSTFTRLVGVDINEKMVDYATNNYRIPKVSFKKLDIGGDISDFIRKNDPFDHIISFFCLHLVPDQKLATQNVYNLLEVNGDCFLHVLAEFTGFDIYKRMYAKWSEHMVDIDSFVSPYYHRINPADMLRKHLKTAGFKEYNVIERRKTVAYHDVQAFIGAFKPIFPFFNRIPLDRQTEFLDEYVKLSMEVKPEPGVEVEKFKSSQNVNLYVSYKLLIAYARK